MNRVNPDIIKESRITLLKYMLISFAILFMISFFVLFFLEKSVRKVQFEELISREQHVIALENIILDKEYRMVLEDLKFLQHTFNNTESSHKTDLVATIWREFSTHRGIYDQIRFIDCNGDEKVRINYISGKGEIVPENQLQNKASRYYFKASISLDEESIFISALDLNVENGIVEKPYKPVIRIATPLYNSDKTLKGIIVLNYLADHMIDSFRDTASNSSGEIVLLNSDGYWLSSENPDLEYSFMFPELVDQNYATLYPEEWHAILQGQSQSLTQNGLFISSPVMLNSLVTMDLGYSGENKISLGTGNWHIVSSVLRENPNEKYFADDNQVIMRAVLKKNSLYFLLIFSISVLIAYLVFLNRKAYLAIKFYSEYDALTKTFNRRAGLEKLKEMVPLGERRKFNLSLCFLDVNGLKTVNDNLGHKDGDELIQSAVQGIKDQIRKKDFIIRFGGDEFLVVLCNSNLEEAELIWQRIVASYDHINQTEKRPYNLSVSHGIVEVTNESEEEIEELIKCADEKMYEEKRVIKETIQTLK